MPHNMYLLQNCSAGFCGNSPLFWASGGGGYTPWIDDAKRWTYKEALAQIRSTTGSHSWKIWPLDLIEANAKRTVDMQDLRKHQPPPQELTELDKVAKQISPQWRHIWPPDGNHSGLLAQRSYARKLK